MLRLLSLSLALTPEPCSMALYMTSLEKKEQSKDLPPECLGSTAGHSVFLF